MTDLADRLTALAVDICLVTGLSTSGCVRATILDALCHSFVPLVVEDAFGDRNAGVHAANIFDLGQKYAEIVRRKVAIGYLESLR